MYVDVQMIHCIKESALKLVVFVLGYFYLIAGDDSPWPGLESVVFVLGYFYLALLPLISQLVTQSLFCSWMLQTSKGLLLVTMVMIDSLVQV